MSGDFIARSVAVAAVSLQVIFVAMSSDVAIAHRHLDARRRGGLVDDEPFVLRRDGSPRASGNNAADLCLRTACGRARASSER
jgi:hypothetical protein